MFLSMVSIDSCMIIHYIVKGNIFVVIVYTSSLQKKYENAILKIALKLMGNKRLRCLRKIKILNTKVLKGKQNHHSRSIPILKLFGCLKIMESKIQMSLLLINIKNMLLVVMVTNQYVLMIKLVNLLNNTQAKMLFTILLAV